ncbi:MAG: DUF1735 domain-containing protein [Bacteroidales bacterium]|nr:DUF1735 domain-containing protein [Bacteroidales bacterium]MBN2763721.1 DUF1735 domain-containing protein [Bacteroidales bacterium]
MKKLNYILLIVLTVLTACENKDWDFPDFEYTTVYFPYQAPVRTLVLGKDYVFDNSLDNEHKCLIMATTGGVYENINNITIDVVVDNSLCNNLRCASVALDTTTAVAMPDNYYSLPAGMQIVIPSGEMMGGIEVQLTDAFFADPRALENIFIIPLRMVSVTNADSILNGSTEVEDPDPRVTSDWTTVPKDYILYAVKYINPWHANYLRRGTDVVKGNNGNTALDAIYVYHEDYVEQDMVCTALTRSRNEVSIAMETKADNGSTDLPFIVMVSFDGNNNCTCSSPDTASYTLTGSGKFVEDGDMWGDKKRDVLHLNYAIDFGTTTHTFTDTLVVRDRGVKFETFTPIID